MRRLLVRAAVLAAGLLVTVNAPALAQNNVVDLRPADINSDGDVTYGLFIYNHLFADDKFLFEAIYLRVPGLDVYEDYDEYSVGGGMRFFKARGLQLYGMAHFAVATDKARFFQPGMIMQFANGRWEAASFVQRYVSLTDNAYSGWLIDPAEIHFRIAGPVSLGASAYLYRADGGSALTKIGPKVSVADKYGATEFRIAHVNQGASVEYQVRRLIIF
jgi:hypothetical protein